MIGPELLLALSRGEVILEDAIKLAQICHDAIDKIMATSPDGTQPPLLLEARKAAEMVLGHLTSHQNTLPPAAPPAPPVASQVSLTPPPAASTPAPPS